MYTAANRNLIDDVRSSILFLKVILAYIVENASPSIFFTKLDELLEPLETNIYLPSDYDGKLESFYYDTHKLWEAVLKHPDPVTFRPIKQGAKLDLHIEVIEYLKRQTSFLPDEIKENINTVSQELAREAMEITSPRSQFDVTTVYNQKYSKVAEAYIFPNCP